MNPEVGVDMTADEVAYQVPADTIDFRYATDCNIEGTWYNALGSELILNVTDAGQLAGEFRTAVEREAGSAGTGPGHVTGWTSTDGTRKAVSFTVMWRGGASVTAWTGLCHVCSGVEMIKTTWVMTHDVDSCDEHWSSNRIGQDDFTRFEQAPGPRQRLGIDSPLELAAKAQEFMDGVLSQAQQGF